MNILKLLTQKKEVSFLTTTLTIEQGLTLLKVVRYNSVPLLDNEGYYVGTITEGDILWYLEENNFEKVRDNPLKAVRRNRDYKPVTINASTDELLKASLGQNFIPILDDRNYFIGMVTRKDLLTAFIEKAGMEDNTVSKNPVLDNIFQRRSIRRFKDEKIDKTLLDDILKAGLVSPTARNKKAQHIMLFDNNEKIREISRVHQKGGHFEKAPYLILVLNDNEQENDRYLAISNTGGIVMSMLLAIESNVGLGGFWIGCGNDEHNNSLLKLLGIPENMSLFGMIAFGVKDEYKEHNTAVINDKIHVNNW